MPSLPTKKKKRRNRNSQISFPEIISTELSAVATADEGICQGSTSKEKITKKYIYKCDVLIVSHRSQDEDIVLCVLRSLDMSAIPERKNQTTKGKKKDNVSMMRT